MSLSIKAIKNSIGSEDFSNYLQNSKKYFTLYSQLTKAADTKTASQASTPAQDTIKESSTNISVDKNYNKAHSNLLQNKQGSINNSSNQTLNHFSDSNSFSGELVRDEIFNWFFSLPIESRVKIATVENSWFTNMINQMFFHYKCDNKSVFQMKNFELFEDKEKDKENKLSVSISSGKFKDKELIKNSKNSNALCFKQGDVSQFKDEDLSLVNLMNYFNFKSNKNSDQIEMIEQILLNDLNFYSVHSTLDCMSLGVRVLKEDSIFKYFFQYIGSSKSFCSLIKPVYDKQNKCYYYNLPDWFNPSEYYSIGKYIMAYLEQTIVVKFVLNYQNYKKDLGNNPIGGGNNQGLINQNSIINNLQNSQILYNKSSPTMTIALIHSLINEEKLTQVFINRKNIIGFLNKNYSTDDQKRDLISVINPGRIYNEIIYDKDIKNIIKLKDRHQEIGYRSFVSRRFAVMEPFFSGKNENETKEKIQELLLKNHPVLFLDKTTFISLDTVWKIDYFLGKRIFEILQDMYTEKNAMDLINDLENEFSENSNKTSTQNTKKGKKNSNKNKGKNNLTQTQNQNKQLSAIEKTSQTMFTEKNLESSVSAFAKDPDYEYYLPYLDDNKYLNKSVIGNSKSNNSASSNSNNIYSNTISVNRNNVPTTIINLKTGEIKTDKPISTLNSSTQSTLNKDVSLSGYYKEKFVDSYQIGNAKMIQDFMKNYVIQDLIEKAVTKAKSPSFKESSSLNRNSLDVPCMYMQSHKNENDTIIHKNELGSTVTNEIKKEKILENNFDDIVNYEVKDELMNVNNISYSNIENSKGGIEEERPLDCIIKPDVHKNFSENNEINEEKLNINKMISQHDTEYQDNNRNNEMIIGHNNRRVKKQKEPKFFLYDTTKRKKDKHQASANTNPNSTANTNPNSTANINVIKSCTDKINFDKTTNQLEINSIIEKEIPKPAIVNEPAFNSDSTKLSSLEKKEEIHSDISIKNLSNNNDVSSFLCDDKEFKNSNQSTEKISTAINSDASLSSVKYENKICSNSTSININSDSKKETNTQDLHNPNNLNNPHCKSSPYKPHSINYRQYPKSTYKNQHHNNHSLNAPHSHVTNQDSNTPIIRNNYYIFNTITHVTSQNTNGNMGINLPTINNLNNLSTLNNISSINNINGPTTNPMTIYYPNTSNNNPPQPNLVPVHHPVSTPTNINNISLNKYSNDFLTFVYKLHNDILTYHKNVTEILENLKEIKIFSINYIEKSISGIISDHFLVDVYGSFASDLSIESSDIDMKIRIKNSNLNNSYEFDLDEMIISIVKHFQSKNLFDSVIPIYTASVPIIKIVIDPYKIADDDNLLRLEEFRHSELYKNYKFNKSEIEKIKIDLTFLDVIENINGIKSRITGRLNPMSIINNPLQVLTKTVNNPNPNQMSSVEYAKNIIIVFPEIKPLIQFLKRYLQIKKMNSCFNGMP